MALAADPQEWCLGRRWDQSVTGQCIDQGPSGKQGLSCYGLSPAAHACLHERSFQLLQVLAHKAHQEEALGSRYLLILFLSKTGDFLQNLFILSFHNKTADAVKQLNSLQARLSPMLPCLCMEVILNSNCFFNDVCHCYSLAEWEASCT